MHPTAKSFIELCIEKKVTVAAAESCTGGLVAKLLTDVPGSSAVFERGFVTYSNEAKEALLAVPYKLIEGHGAVSSAVAKSMADGALAHSLASVSVSVTGIAGPDGGSVEKPVGLVHFACSAIDGETEAEQHVFNGDREEIRNLAALKAIEIMMHRIRGG